MDWGRDCSRKAPTIAPTLVGVDAGQAPTRAPTQVGAGRGRCGVVRHSNLGRGEIAPSDQMDLSRLKGWVIWFEKINGWIGNTR